MASRHMRTFNTVSIALIAASMLAVAFVPVGCAASYSAVTVSQNNSISTSYFTAALYTYSGGTYTPIATGAFNAAEAEYDSSYHFPTDPVKMSVDDLYIGISLSSVAIQGTYAVAPSATTQTSNYSISYIFKINNTSVASGGSCNVNCSDGGVSSSFYFPVELSCVISYSGASEPSDIQSLIDFSVNATSTAMYIGDGSVSVSESATVETIVEEIEETIEGGGSGEYTLVETPGTEPGTIGNYTIARNGDTNIVVEKGNNRSVNVSFQVPNNTPFILKVVASFEKNIIVTITIGDFSDNVSFKTASDYLYLTMVEDPETGTMVPSSFERTTDYNVAKNYPIRSSDSISISVTSPTGHTASNFELSILLLPNGS